MCRSWCPNPSIPTPCIPGVGEAGKALCDHTEHGADLFAYNITLTPRCIIRANAVCKAIAAGWL
ncbi:hypothetical protein, partial [Nostoc sp. CHAB 5715]|uniref:hypothetical protein n=1 Tax=Nostoc sp. CHAB 5715 TaxID=2780400 RepID=UPI001E5660D8